MLTVTTSPLTTPGCATCASSPAQGSGLPLIHDNPTRTKTRKPSQMASAATESPPQHTLERQKQDFSGSSVNSFANGPFGGLFTKASRARIGGEG